MVRDNPIAVVEIGTTRTVCLVGRPESGTMNVRGVGTAETTGVRKGEVVELSYAVQSVRTAIERASRSARCDIRDAWLIFSGGHTGSCVTHGRHAIPPRHRVVKLQDIAKVRALAQEGAFLPEGRHQLHLLLQHYVLDDVREVINPVNLPAHHIQARMLLVHTLRTSLDAMRRAMEGGQVVVTGYLFGALCAAQATLSPEQMAGGVLLVHLGGGTTSYVAYANGMRVMAGSFGIGGDHVTNDIQQAFHLTSVKAAETMKLSASATVDGAGAAERGNVPSRESLGEVERTFSARSLSMVVNARYDETFRILHGLMEGAKILPLLGSGVVLTGGPALQKNLPQLVTRIFNKPCVVGAVPEVSGLGDGAMLAAAYGALRIVDQDRKVKPLRPSKPWWPFTKGAQA
ncbi:MAG: cell division protein FtsA [Kiritimatiellaeota bacterium]|nr:cell division protein FtsA [Kiritimatiellota bacterium]